MADAMEVLNQEHMMRQLQRAKMKGPIVLVGVLVAAAGIAGGVILGELKHEGAGLAAAVAGIFLALLWLLSAKLLAEWDRAVILRLGRFKAVKGPGFFTIFPILDRVMRVVDMRVRTTSFRSEAMLTKDTVQVSVDATAFWHVWDARKAVLEVESYYRVMALAVQTALRDIVGVHTLAEILSEREQIGETLQKVLRSKTRAWGITVNSIEIRDIAVPETLKDALSKQAQAERERQARTILGLAETEIAEKFAEAAKAYEGNPVALQLRAMNIIYEGLRSGGTLMLVPSSILDSMNLGGLVALGAKTGPAKQQELPPGGTS